MKKVLVTGSAGLIGSEACLFFAEKDFEIIGIDNNMRQYFFGPEASTLWNRKQMQSKLSSQYTHYNMDIRNKNGIDKIFRKHSIDLIIHAAAQPSHDWAVKEPLTDFSINATGTLNLLEAYRQHSPKATFIFTSTNKVYGDSPNSLPLVEYKTRYDLPKKHHYYKGINEQMSIDQTKHSLFGVSKVAADVMVQEYGRYFKLHTGIFRGGCLTGPAHSGAKLHGFLSYLVKCIKHKIPYTIIGYKGKQVRDNIHSYDLINMFWNYHKKPGYGEVFNAGGSRHSNVSVLEAISKIEKELGAKAKIKINKKPRIGDHQWYISDISKFKKRYPNWSYKYDIDSIIHELCVGEYEK